MTAASMINRLLNEVGFQIVRRSTSDTLISSASSNNLPPEPARAHDPISPDLRLNEEAHNFRKVAQADELMEQVPASYLRNLQRESLALREMSAELIRLKAQLEGANNAAAVGSSEPTRDQTLYTPVYDYTGLRTDPATVHNHDFMRDPRFTAAYNRGAVAEGFDPRYYWRTHVALWCASVAAKLSGDFVECGVCRGMLSSSIMTYLNWNRLDRRFVMFDTFTGVDEAIVSEEEVASGNLGYFREMYKEDIYDKAVRNFSEFKNVEIIRGSVPSTLSAVDINSVAYLSIDMNNVTPEIAAINHFWDRLQAGAPVLLDDYGFVRYETQKRAFDAWAAEHGVEIFAIPTGQGLIIKPPV
ncbi:TylF/MycF/NovP-related O-methyltransferase [Bradyrhizobium betae]